MPFDDLTDALATDGLNEVHHGLCRHAVACQGFAVGTGFAFVENLYYLYTFPEANIGTWIVRGFGTAMMHGGTTAVFAMMGLTMLEQRGRSMVVAAAFRLMASPPSQARPRTWALRS